MEMTIWALANGAKEAPSILSTMPFVVLLLAIAILPLHHGTLHWWEKNRNKLLISILLATITLVYYWLREVGFHHAGDASAAGFETFWAVLKHALLADYVPFMVMLF